MSVNAKHDTRTLSDNVFKIFWFAGILGLGIILPIYFTMTETGTATWIIKGQAWIFKKLSGTAKWYPVLTGLLICVIHIFILLGIVQGISWIGGLIKKKE